jgi:peptidyl-prolyl cis-trans isomerase B (cyclophilin B)
VAVAPRLPVRRGLAALAAVVLASLAAGCGGGSSSSSSGESTTTSTAAAVSGCRDVPKATSHPKKLPGPTKRLDPKRSYDLIVKTNCGTFTIALDPRTSPNTVTSLVYLARKHFFDGVGFHRIVPGFVIQGGDPTGTGGGGPGYATRDPVPPTLKYTTGTVAMAKTPDDPPGRAGSQFFVMTGPAPQLPPEYALAGHVVKGLAVVKRIGKLGNAQEQPTRPVVMESVRAVVH